MSEDYRTRLLDKIARREAKIGIIGLGYVGLPMAVAYGSEGFQVVGIDVDARKVDLLNKGESYIDDVRAETISRLVQDGRLRATTDYAAIRNLDAISICVPTPLRKTRDPDLSYVVTAADGVAEHIQYGQLVVLESTTYPGTTDEIILPRLLNNGFVIGENVFIAFSPERIDPANKTYGVRNTPRVIGGSTPACTAVATALYGSVTDTIVPVSSTKAAEMVKLLENTFRAVNIGLVNEIAIMCDKLGIDVWEVINAAKSKPFGFMPFYPGPGLGGHCIPIDPLYLSWKLKTLNYNARFIELADEINTNMPRHVVNKVAEALNDARKPINGSNILVLGVAYKPNVSDVRESPALDIIQLLQQRGATVTYCDPHVPTVHFDEGDLHSVAYSPAILSAADCVVIVTDHTAFNYDEIFTTAAVIVDTRNALSKLTPGLTPTAQVTRL